LQEITGKINLAKIDDFVDTIDAISDIQKRFYKTMIKQRFEKILWHSSVKLQGRTV